MKIKTEILQSIVAKAIQGTSNNKMIPLTSLIGIEIKQDTLTLTTTDGNNQFKVSAKIEYDPMYGPQEFYTIVNADTFAKLVGKTTKEYITLENKENYLEVVGNGTYKLEIAINEEGQIVRFPVIFEQLPTVTAKIKLSTLQEAIKVSKASIAKTMELPCITGYYISDNIITTNREMICILQDKLIDFPILLSSEMAELILLLEGETVELVEDNNYLILFTSNYVITGKELEGKSEYPAKEILSLLSTQYNNEVRVNKDELLSVLDRMNLFVSDYDKNGIYLDFTEAGLIIRSQKSNAEEVIEINSPLDADGRFNCLIDIEMLKAQVETISTDVVEIAYGQDKSIKIVDGNVIHIISLAEKQ